MKEYHISINLLEEISEVYKMTINYEHCDNNSYVGSIQEYYLQMFETVGEALDDFIKVHTTIKQVERKE